MAISSTWIRSLKVMLISTGVVSIAIMMKFSVPLVIDFVVYEIPVIWSRLMSWLRPPYLYFIINGIIITIAAASRFHQKLDDQNESEPMISSKPPPTDLHSGYAISPRPEFGVVETPPAVYEREVLVSEDKTVVLNGPEAEDENEEAFEISRSAWMPERTNSSEILPEYLSSMPEKPLVSSRFGHRKPLKASPEGGRALRVAKPKRHDTLESTWKTITDGRHMPLTRHLRKSDTWEHHGRQFNAAPEDHSPEIVKKSETFRDRTGYDPPPSSSPSSGKLRKEPTLSHDELNRRVEAFINKFNEEMRLQRQESLKQYMEMINRGAH